MLEPTQDNQQIIERIAALDIGKAELVCCVRAPDGQAAGKRLQEVATYPTMTRSLLGMCDRLRQVGVTRVVMEATSDYWKPPFYLPVFDLAGWIVKNVGLLKRSLTGDKPLLDPRTRSRPDCDRRSSTHEAG